METNDLIIYQGAGGKELNNAYQLALGHFRIRIQYSLGRVFPQTHTVCRHGYHLKSSAHPSQCATLVNYATKTELECIFFFYFGLTVVTCVSHSP